MKLKKTVSVALSAVLAVSLLAGGAVQASALSADAAAPAAVTEENCISGSWKRADSPVVTQKIQRLFDKAFADLEGAVYTPAALLATQRTVTGTQYRVLCKMTLCIPDAEEQYVVVTLRQGLLGRVEVTDIGAPLTATDLDYEPGAVGAWQEMESPVITEDAAAAFSKATEGFVGVDYVPVALLSEQVAAGTQYRFLCEATTVYPGAEMHYAVVTVYESLEGNANIISATDSYIS